MTPISIGRRLADLERFGAEAAYIVDQGWGPYSADTLAGRTLRNAGERVLIKVATVAEKLPADFTDRFPDVDWVGITRMRNLVAHHYDKVNDELMWRALRVRVPELLHALGRTATDIPPP